MYNCTEKNFPNLYDNLHPGSVVQQRVQRAVVRAVAPALEEVAGGGHCHTEIGRRSKQDRGTGTDFLKSSRKMFH